MDIIVFPEEGLQTVYHPVRKDLFPWSIEIPAPSRDYAACDSNDTSVREVSRVYMKLKNSGSCMDSYSKVLSTIISGSTNGRLRS